LYSLFGQHAQVKKLSISFVSIKTPHLKKDEFNKFPLFDDDKLIDHIDIYLDIKYQIGDTIT